MAAFSSGLQGKPLTALIHEISDCLKTNDSSSVSNHQSSQTHTVAHRLRAVLPVILDLCVDTPKVREKDLMPVLKLVKLVLNKVPNMFAGTDCAAAFHMLKRLLPLCAEENLLLVHAQVLDTVCTLLTLLAAGNTTAYQALYQGALELLADVQQVVCMMCTPALLPLDASVSVSCFQKAFVTACSPQLAAHPESAPTAESAALPPPFCCVRLRNVQQCQLLASNVLPLAAHCLRSDSLLLGPRTQPRPLAVAADLMQYGASYLQLAALDFLGCATAELMPQQGPLAEVLEAALSLLDSWRASGQAADPLMQPWHGKLAQLLQDVVEGLSAVGRLPSEAMGIAQVLGRALRHPAICPGLRDHLSHTFSSICARCPALLEQLPGVMDMLHLEGAVSEAVVLSLAAYIAQLPAGCIQAAVQRQSTASEASQAVVQVQERSEGNKLRKRRRLDAGTTVASAPIPPHHTQHPQAAELNVQPPTSPAPHYMTASVSGSLLRQLLDLLPQLAPAAQSSHSTLHKFHVLGVLASSMGSTAPLLRLLAPCLGAWVKHGLQVAQSGTEPQLAPAERAALTAALDSFAMACISCSSNGSSHTHINSPIHAQHFEAACELFALLDVGVQPLTWLAEQCLAAEQLQSAMSCNAKLAALRVVLAAATLLPDKDAYDYTGFLTQRAMKDRVPEVRAAAAAVAPATMAAVCRNNSVGLSQVPSQSRASFMKDSMTLLGAQLADSEPVVRRSIAEALQDMLYFDTLCSDDLLGLQRTCSRVGQLGLQNNGCNIRQPRVLDTIKTEVEFAALERFCNALLFEETAEEVQVSMLHTIVRYLRVARPSSVAAAQELVDRCLALASHPSQLLRNAFVATADIWGTPNVVFGDPESGRHPLQELKKQFDAATRAAVKESLLASLAAAGGVDCSGDVQLLLLAVLIGTLDCPDTSLRAVAAQLLEGLAAQQQVEVADLVFGVPQLLEWVGRSLAARRSLLLELAELMEFEPQELALRLLPAALPVLVETQDRDGLEALAQEAGLEVAAMVHEYGHHVVAKVLFEGSCDFTTFMGFLESLLAEDFITYLKGNMQLVIMEIISIASRSADWKGKVDLPKAVHERAHQMLQVLVSICSDAEQSVPGFLADCDQVTKILKLYGDKLEQQPYETQDEINDLRQVLRGILLLIRLTGQYVGRFLPQLMVLLTGSVRQGKPEKLKLQALRGWHTLVRALAQHAPLQLASVLNQVVVTLLEPLQDSRHISHGAAQVVEELVIRCRDLLQERLRGLPPLPHTIPALAQANAVLAEQRGRLTGEEQVALLLPSLAHQSLSVRGVSLQELRDYLHEHRTWLGGLLTGGTLTTAAQHGDNALLSQLMKALLKCCDPEVRLPLSLRTHQTCAECLGLLGAVDPARLKLDVAPPPPMHLGNLQLLTSLIGGHLARLLRVAPQLEVLDAATFAIQELLHDYSRGEGASPGQAGDGSGRRSREGTPVEGNHLFAALSEDVREMVRPYLDSKFTIKGAASASRGAVFGSRPDLSFRKWLFLWLKQLVHATSGARAKLFHACVPVMRCDIQTSLFLMPYIVQNVVSGGGDEARSGVAAEVEAVLRGGRANKDGELCVQAVFSLLDILKRWIDDHQRAGLTPSSGTSGQTKGSVSGRSGSGQEEDSEARPVAELLDAIPQDLLAQAAFQCGAHARALLYYETHVRALHQRALNPAALRSGEFSDDEVTFLQEVYGKLEEPDGLEGLVCLRRGGPRTQDQVLADEKAGRWSDALSLYEQALQGESSERPESAAGAAAALPQQQQQQQQEGLSSSQRGYLRCLLQMGQLQGMLTHVDGLISTASEVGRAQLAAAGAAAAWRLGRWGLLEDYLQLCGGQQHGRLQPEDRWEVRIGALLAAAAARHAGRVGSELEAARREIMAPLSAASMESYTRAYPLLVKLHMLQELQDAFALLREPEAGPATRAARLRWDERLGVTQSSLQVQEPILALRRQLAQLADAPVEAGRCWLQHAKLCRATGHHEAAAAAALKAVEAGVPGAALERAKLLWAADRPHRAILDLRQVVRAAAEAREGGGRGQAAEAARQQRRGEAKALLLLARWMAETGQGCREDITALFEGAVALEGRWEKGFFRYATYLDQLMRDAKQRQDTSLSKGPAAGKGLDRLGGKARIKMGQDQPHHEILPQVLEAYARSLQHGHRHVYQSLPRMLTLWFEYGTYTAKNPRLAVAGPGGKTVTAVMAELFRVLPMAVCLVALPQLTSRICHQNPEVQVQTQQMVTTILEAYPQQALWALAAVAKSTMEGRKKAASAILAAAKKRAATDATRRLYSQATELHDQLIKLAYHDPGKNVKVFSVRRDFSHLFRMMPLGVMMPLSATLTVSLPPAGAADRHFDPCPALITIAGLRDEVEVMASLQKPKKIVMTGSDGRQYTYLAKPKDDLRKDNRMMELTGVLNRLLAKNPASRRRNLYIRRFAVIPLTEECGLIEWVPAVQPLRHAVQGIYAVEGLYKNHHTHSTINKLYTSYPPDKRRAELLAQVLRMFPPRLHRWFLRRFTEPAAWHTARLAFTRTTAVWAMVGHITGLGDRHGENILLDTVTGDVVHVDFSCLFDKGLTLEKPEMVPFRLTQNIVDAFGVSGYEGAFRRCCEVSLQVLREHKDTLVSVLETFVHDPLVEWVAKRRTADEPDNPHAKDAMATIEGRLMGTLIGVSSQPSLPLSAEGHAHRLIEEATDKENLGQMYIWWMPWW